MPPLCRTKHNRAKPMSESASALFSIADAGEFRFARFYIVCEEVPLGTPESPPIVSGVSDMHPSDCPNVEETRNPMQTFSWKKCSHFSPTNIPSVFPHEIPKCVSHNITYQTQTRYASCGSSFLFFHMFPVDLMLFKIVLSVVFPDFPQYLARRADRDNVRRQVMRYHTPPISANISFNMAVRIFSLTSQPFSSLTSAVRSQSSQQNR